jgi:hypothetical protein
MSCAERRRTQREIAAGEESLSKPEYGLELNQVDLIKALDGEAPRHNAKAPRDTDELLPEALAAISNFDVLVPLRGFEPRFPP